jgi:CRISPR-associated endonuclease/helicase Cas3
MTMSATIFYAHTHGKDKTAWQTLKDHLTNTAQIAFDLAADAGLSAYAFPLGMMHDLGKYSIAFQRRLDGGPRVDHATAGAQEILELLGGSPVQKIIASLFAYCISGHHGGLPDCGSEIDSKEDNTLFARLKKSVEDYQGYKTELDLTSLKQIPTCLPIRPHPKYAPFSVAFLVRMLYSSLVDADFIETETFCNQGEKPRGGYTAVPELAEKFNHYLEIFSHPSTDLHRKRNEILAACLEKASSPQGIYKLTVPTGGGKTFASMAFALNHARTHNLRRVIYVIPYTSIIEQNAVKFKESLGENNVLEHHSNFDWDALKQHLDEDDADENIPLKLKLAAENWDIPVIVTTNVQFFESLFANRSSKCRKLHNIARSVIIFDEAQMIPREFLQPCMLAVNELTTNYKATAVLCTATQPELERFFPDPQKIIELAPDPRSLYAFFKRVHVRTIGKTTDEQILEWMNKKPQVLTIVNTRRHARGLFTGLIGEGCFHLSTLMCPAHRRRKIAEIHERLKANLPCRVVSTQIMEAGIDVDFPIAYRSIAGLDSIVQAAGRVNREARRATGELLVFDPESEFVKSTPKYIQQAAEVCRMTLRGKSDPAALEVITEYYNNLYNLQDTKAFDAHGILAHFEFNCGKPLFEFESAARDFNLIENNTTAIVIPFDATARGLLAAARDAENPWKFSRRLQPYTVNIYTFEFEALEKNASVDLYNGVFNVLNDPGMYDEDTGLQLPQSGGGNAIFVGF